MVPRKRRGIGDELLGIAREALRAADPEVCLRRAVELKGETLRIGERRWSLAQFDRILVVGFGKASARLAAALEGVLGELVSGGLVVTADGYSVPTGRIRVVEAAHPLPDERGLAAAEAIEALARGAGSGDLLIVLISGGGSALLTLPAPGISLADLARTNELLIRSGATIREINAVRKHLSRLKGGQLARLARPALVVSLIISDVPGDPLDVIASGPTAADPTTFRDAASVLEKYGLSGLVPGSVRARIEAGIAGEVPDTPKPGDPLFEGVYNLIIGSGRLVAEEAAAAARRRGLASLLLTTTLEGEAREVGRFLASLAREMVRYGRPLPPPAVVILAGETTVTVRGDGLGGRNQELALAAALAMRGLPGVALLSLGTDGRDGPTDAAGGLVDGGTASRIEAARLDPGRALRDNDSYRALSAAGALIKTGPTGTNVADLVLLGAGKEVQG